MIRLSTIVRGISQGVAQIGLAAVVVQEVIRVEVIAQLQVAEVDVRKRPIPVGSAFRYIYMSWDCEVVD